MQIKQGKLQYEDKKKNSTMTKVILTLIILVVILIIAIMCAIIYIGQTSFKAHVDGVGVNMPQDIIIKDENTDKIYIDVKQIAEYLDYEAHNGEYKLYTEDTNKCWVYCKNETASFFLNSNKISKVEPDTTKDYEDYTIEDPVIGRNGKLYASIEGIKIGFNVTVEYDSKTNTLDIYTLPYLTEYYDKIIKGYGYQGVSSNFNNQKAILYDLFIVNKGNSLFGVIDSKNNEIIGSRYKSIIFNENANEFYVSDNSNKVGIVTPTGDTKINLLYDSISMIDKQNGLYMVKENNKYGVLNRTGEIVIHAEYDSLGVDTSKFTADKINNKYVLYNNLIPVYQNKKWGFFNINGDIIIPIEFDYLGCTAGKGVNSLLLVPNYKGIVIGKKREVVDDNRTTSVDKYAIYDFTGKELVPCELDSAYSVINAGVQTYSMEYQENILDIEKYLQRITKTTTEIQGTDDEQTQKTGTNTVQNNNI